MARNQLEDEVHNVHACVKSVSCVRSQIAHVTAEDRPYSCFDARLLLYTVSKNKCDFVIGSICVKS